MPWSHIKEVDWSLPQGRERMVIRGALSEDVQWMHEISKTKLPIGLGNKDLEREETATKGH